MLALAEEAKIAGAQEGGEFVHLAAVIERVEQAYAGKAERSRQVLGRPPVTEIEQIGRIEQRLDHAVGHQIHPGLMLEDAAAMEELQAEIRAAIPQQGTVGAKIDAAEIVIAQPLQALRQGLAGADIGLARQLPRLGDHRLRAKGIRRRQGAAPSARQAGTGRSGQLQRGTSGQVHFKAFPFQGPNADTGHPRPQFHVVGIGPCQNGWILLQK